MSYLGSKPDLAPSTIREGSGVGDAVTVDFDMGFSVDTEIAVLIFINGVKQDTDAYSILGTICTFSAAPSDGSNLDFIGIDSINVLSTGALASSVSITDAGNQFTGANVEAALQETLVDGDFGTAGLMKTDGAGTYSVVAGIDDTVIGGTTPAAGTFTSVTSTGNINVNGGSIKFPATQVPSTDSNTLDDYEEGTWTPVLTDNTFNATMTSGVSGSYVKIGRQVTATANIVAWSSKGSIGSTMFIDGLPFINSDSRCVGSLGVSPVGGFVSGHRIMILLDPGYSSIYLIDVHSTNNEYHHLQAASIGASGTIFGLTLTYITS